MMWPDIRANGGEENSAKYEPAAGNKVLPLEAAISPFVGPQDVVHAAYTGARPSAALFEIARRHASTGAEITLTGTGLAGPQSCLVELGVVRHVVARFVGENYPVARPNPSFQRASKDGRVTVENWSLWSLIARLVAGALGMPFMPVASLHHTSMAQELSPRGYARIRDPFEPPSQEPTVGVASALRPDVVLLQAVVADRSGHVILAPPYGEGHWGALAARRGVIACVERIVDTRELRSYSALLSIPAPRVLAVCETPMGAHPYSLFNPGVPRVEGYVEHRTAMASAAEASRNPAGFRRWIDEWIIEPGSHDRYLAMLGTERQRTLKYQAQPDYWRDEAEHAGAATGPAGHSETHVIVAGRYIAERIAACANEMVLSGVGQANLAAWLGVDAARRDGHAVELMAEIGMVGYTPRPGEPFVFAHRNYYTSTMLTDSMTVLGSLIAGPGTRSLGVSGAGQVDQQGNVNSTYAADGRFLVGSGGVNDIAAGADEVVIVTSHSPSRLAGELPYLTSSGQAVRAVVTDLGVFERAEDGLVLTRLLPASGSDERDALAVMRARSGWDFPVARRLTREREPEAHELTLLRAIRPSRRLHWKLTTRRPNIPTMGAYSGQGAAR